MSESNKALADISPTGLRAYLRSNGWHIKGRPRATVELWERNDHEILVPLNGKAPDYPRRVENFVEDLAQERRTPENDIARELLYIEDDVINLRMEESREYVPLANVSKLIDGARGLAVASACSAITRRAYHGKSRPKRALEYTRLVGMGHTAHGSFIIPIISPVGSMQPIIIDNDVDPLLDIDTEQTFFPRRVTGMMADIFKEIHRLAVEPPRMPSKEELSRAVVGGLSADACLAVAAMVGTQTTGNLDVTFRWALASTPPRAGGEQMDFPKESAGVIREVGHVLRNEVMVSDTVLYGFVSSLDREPSDEEGTVKVKALVSGRIRPVKIILRGDAYHTAVEAHDLRLRVIATGAILRSASGSYSVPRVDLFRIDDYLPMETSEAE